MKRGDHSPGTLLFVVAWNYYCTFVLSLSGRGSCASGPNLGTYKYHALFKATLLSRRTASPESLHPLRLTVQTTCGTTT